MVVPAALAELLVRRATDSAAKSDIPRSESTVLFLLYLTSTQPAASARAAVGFDSEGLKRHKQGLTLLLGAAVCRTAASVKLGVPLNDAL